MILFLHLSKCKRFLLTRLMRGATLKLCVSGNSYIISTHTPLTKRDDFKLHIAVPCQVSTHTPHARRDFHGIVIYFFGSVFLLTHLLRGATSTALSRSGFALISTHTPLARRDSAQTAVFCIWEGFYSHASCEARHNRSRCEQLFELFLLTRLMRGATLCALSLSISYQYFYSRASCERDWHHPQIESIHFQFLLPRLLRGATKKRSFVSHTFRISTPTPLARRDAWQYSTSQNPKISTHAPLARRDSV